MRKFQQQPLVPIGAVVTTFALIMAGSKLRRRESTSMNYWLRARVIAQGFTIAAVIAGSWMMGQTKPQLDQAAAAETNESGSRGKRKAEFEERLREAEESHRLEMAAAGKTPLGHRQIADVETHSNAPKGEVKEGSGYWPEWATLGKGVWSGGSTTATPSVASTPVVPPSTPSSSASTSDGKRS